MLRPVLIGKCCELNFKSNQFDVNFLNFILIYYLAKSSIKYLTLLNEEEILSDLLIKAFDLSISILFSPSPFEMNVVFNKKTKTIEDVCLDNELLFKRAGDVNTKFSDNNNSKEEVYFNDTFTFKI